MKKQYIFLILIWLIFYFSYSIIQFVIDEYRIKTNIQYIENIIEQLEWKIEISKNTIELKTSKAYKNKILKEQQSFKNIWENVIYFKTEEDFNKYTTEKKEEKIEEKIIIEDATKEKIKNLNIYDRWKYFLFKIENEKI